MSNSINFKEIKSAFYDGHEMREIWMNGAMVWNIYQTPTNGINLFDKMNQEVGRLDHRVGYKWGDTPFTGYLTDGYRTISPIQISQGKTLISACISNGIDVYTVVFDSNLKVSKLLTLGERYTISSNDKFIGAYTTSKNVNLDTYWLREVNASDNTETEIKRTSKKCRATFTNTVDDKAPVLDKPVFGSPYAHWYTKNEVSVNGDSVVLTTKFEYISYLSGSGTRRYVPIREYNPYTGTYTARFGTITYL